MLLSIRSVHCSVVRVDACRGRPSGVAVRGVELCILIPLPPPPLPPFCASAFMPNCENGFVCVDVAGVWSGCSDFAGAGEGGASDSGSCVLSEGCGVAEPADGDSAEGVDDDAGPPSFARRRMRI